MQQNNSSTRILKDFFLFLLISFPFTNNLTVKNVFYFWFSEPKVFYCNCHLFSIRFDCQFFLCQLNIFICARLLIIFVAISIPYSSYTTTSVCCCFVDFSKKGLKTYDEKQQNNERHECSPPSGVKLNASLNKSVRQ